ncbi:PREDICTED: nuclear-pore anchor-like isoform X1 [Lupinus angustifolius]|uniref:nuclear-pore anchor-like isoform X1 n=1 Tax=Lupinus angustifolius TaxID=3871 RepID=UPI00092ED215|nr:PREDICTED: nuclear-pore anchor-like isoform X1 [Lupinus angustifolius]
MPLFISDEEFSRCAGDTATVAAKADAFIRGLLHDLDTVRARADAADINAEQNCSLIEQKYLSLAAEFSKFESQVSELQSSLDQRQRELAETQSQNHQANLKLVEKDREIESLRTEVGELHKSKRQLIELNEQKDLEISEKNATIKSYLDKIVRLTENAAHKEARLSEVEAELGRLRSACTRFQQEKDILERQNAWLNDELTAKVNSFFELRRKHTDLDADMSSKLTDVERQFSECSKSLQWNKDRVRELEVRLKSTQEALISAKDAAATNEERLSTELSTVNKLNELYKESYEEWSRKAADLEGVIKAMELHLKQGEDVYKEKLEKELCARKQVEKEAADLKERLEECEAEIQTRKKANESNNLSLTSFTAHPWFASIEVDNMVDENSAIVPKIPVGVSGTALAASLMRDGWSLAKMYAKYQEAVDAFRHEQLGRKESEAILQRVLYELEEKAEAIVDERAEHEKMADAYSLMNQKLQNSLTENTYLEKTIQELQADLKRSERDYNLAQNEINDLQKQVTVLLKECQEMQLRGGSIEYDIVDVTASITSTTTTETEAEKVISEHLLTFKGINGLVEQNVQLRSLVHSLSGQIENQEVEFKEKLEMELTKHTEAASSKVEAVLQRAEEQGHMIESLHTSVAMYKRLYEEEHNKLPHSHSTEALAAVAEVGRIDLKASIESSQEAAKKSFEKVAERVKYLEDDLAKSRSEIIVLRSERDKMALEANFARERLESFMKELEHQKAEVNGVLARNLEFSQLIVDYQQKLRESSELLSAAEERCRKHSMELSVLKHEKEILSNAEKRASDEVHSLSERVQRLQASLGTIQSAEEVREEARASERAKHEEYVKKLENEWAEAKKELQDERENVRRLSLDLDQTLKNSLRLVEDMSKELNNALRAATSADSRAAAAEAKLCSLQRKMGSTDDDKVAEMDGASGPSTLSSDEVVAELQAAKEEIEKLKEEALANKAHMLQYKGIAEVNEDALKQIEVAHENYKIESDKAKRALEAELHSLKEKVSELENECSLKSEAVTSATAGKEEALASAFAEITNLKEEILSKSSQISEMEIQISGFKEHLDKEHQRWHTAQKNYERQVILQSETIQELTKTSEALALLQEEASELRKSTDAQKIENSELKAKWEEEKVALEKARSDAEKKYDEINEQNKILHSQLDALHIRWAEKERSYAGVSSGSSSADLFGDASLQNVINYLRRSKEIAETEVSLLKQEKLRLQSQLESALKAAESAHAKLEAERAKSKSFLFTEEEFKALQLQVQEMNLLRESNMQLREENKHNFEEWQKSCEQAQKARAEIENLENLLRQKEIELEGRKNEIEALKMEKDHLNHKVSELMERSKNVDLEDYDRVKKLVRDLQDKLRDKDARIEEFAKIVSEKQVSVSRLEQDLSNCRLEFTEKEKRINDILHVEASLKLEAEKHRKLLAQFKKRIDVLSREKEELGKDNQQLARQLDEIKQSKRSTSDTTGERAMKEEKDTRIQILEKHLERLRDELKKEKEDNRVERSRRLKTEKAIKDSYNNVEQEKTKFINELERHKESLKQLSNEVEKLKIDLSNLPEGTNAAQLFSGSSVDDFVAPYISAVEIFEKESQSMFSELGGRGNVGDASTVPDSSAAATGSLVHAQPPAVAPGESSLPPKPTVDSERRLALPRAGVEARKAGRRLVRPRLVKPDEPQGDAEMSDAEGPGGKPGPSGDTESQSSAALSSQPLARKRIAPTPSSELREESATLGEKSSDVVAPVLKKSKGSESPEVSAEEQPAATSEFTGSHPITEESFDGGELRQGQNEEAGEAQNEDGEIAVERDEESKDPQHMDDTSQEELHGDRTGILEENLDQPSETKVVTDDAHGDHSEPDNQQSTLAPGSEKEEGEMFLDSGDLEGGSDLSNIAENQESREGQSEPAASPEPSPARVDDEALEAGEISPERSMDDKIDEGDMVEEIVDVTDPTVVESDQVADPAPVAGESSLTGSAAETGSSKTNLPVPKQGTTSETEDTKQQQTSPSMSTTINLSERARQRAQLREAGRGRGRASPRGRVLRGRGGQGGRRAPPSGNA